MIRFGDIVIDQQKCLIANGPYAYRFHDTAQRVRFRFVRHLLMSTGMSMKELFDALYDQSAEGGPLQGPHVIQVFICQMQPVFDALNCQIHKAKIAGEMHYWLRPIDVA